MTTIGKFSKKEGLQFEDPLTLLYYQGSHYISNRVIIHPNIITTLRLIIMIGLTISFYYKKFTIIMALLVQFCWFLDHLDGDMARNYNNISKFGDYYDHIVDVTYLLPLYAILIYRLYKKPGFIILLLFLILLNITTSLLISCQEKIFHKKNKETGSNILQLVSSVCNLDKKYLKILKFFGGSTLMLYIGVLMIYVNI